MIVTDCKQVVCQLQEQDKNLSMLGGILDSMKIMMQQAQHCLIKKKGTMEVNQAV